MPWQHGGRTTLGQAAAALDGHGSRVSTAATLDDPGAAQDFLRARANGRAIRDDDVGVRGRGSGVSRSPGALRPLFASEGGHC